MKTLRTFKQFSAENPAFTEGALRHLRFYSTPGNSSRGDKAGNGFREAFVKIGRNVYVDVDAFFHCVDILNNILVGNPSEHPGR